MTADGYDFSGNYKPQIQREWLRTQVRAQPLPTDQLKLNHLNFYGNLMKIADSQTREVINTLAKQGEMNSTMFMSTADHGEMGMPHGGMVQKMFNTYEESIRVPMIWSNPRYFKGGQKSDALVSLIDFLPTVANLYGATEDSIASHDLRGVDYSPIIRRASKESKLNYEKLDVQSSFSSTRMTIFMADKILAHQLHKTHGITEYCQAQTVCRPYAQKITSTLVITRVTRATKPRTGKGNSMICSQMAEITTRISIRSQVNSTRSRQRR
jgi:hypothetical protein